MTNYFFKSLTISLIVLILGFSSLTHVGAVSSNLKKQQITIDEKNYTVEVKSENNLTIATVKDDYGNITEAIFNKRSEKLTVNNQDIQIETINISNLNIARSSNKILKRKTYTIPASLTTSVTVLIAGLSAITNFPFTAAVISAIVSGNLWGKTIKITITEYRTGSKYTSGTHKGKYKYWTNVLVKCGKSTILNQNHSISYK